MKYESFGIYRREEGEPALRSCWNCNLAHGYLKDVDFLHYCFECGRYWIFGQYLDEFKTVEDLDAFLYPKLEKWEMANEG